MTSVPRIGPAAELPFASEAVCMDVHLRDALGALTLEGMLAIGCDGSLICANAALASLWRLPAELLSHRDGLAVLEAMAERARDPENYAAWLAGLGRDRDDRSHSEVLLKDGRVLDQRSIPVPATAERPAGRLWRFSDVTPIKQAAQRLSEAEARWSVLADQELVGICILLADRTVAYANKQFADILGRSPAELHGLPLLDFVPSHVKERVAGFFGARAAGASGLIQFTTVAARRDGSSVDLLVRSAPISYLGQDALLTCVFDTTHLRQAERDLQLANLAIEESPVIAFQAMAQEGFPRTYISQNVSRFGYTAEEAKSGAFTFPGFVHPDDRAAALAAVQATAANGTDLFEQDYRVIARDGSLHWVHDRTLAVRDDAGTLVAYRGTLTDVTQRVIAERKLERTNRALRALSAVNAAVVHATCESELLYDMCRVLVETGGYVAAWTAFAEQDADKSVRPVAIFGEHRDLIARLSLSWGVSVRGDGPAGRAIRTGRAQVNHDFATNPAMAPWRDAWVERGCGSSAALPLKDASGTFGAVILVARETDAFDDAEMALLDEMAKHLSYGIGALRMRAEHDRLHRRLQRSMEETVQALAGTLELRDPYTAGHQRNVAKLAAGIGTAMGLPESELAGITLAASLHDIGKIHIPLEITVKPGKLSIPEMRLMQTHVESGYEVLKGIDFPWPVASMVLQHHERLDGSGYPNGLKGDQILLGAKIIAVADVAESMMAHRPYRPAAGSNAAFDELERGRGTLYHPAAVDACIALVRQESEMATGAGLDPSVQAELVPGGRVMAPAPGGEARPRLTLQQAAVMQLLAQGRSVKEISRALDIAIGTVKTHLQHTYAALGARNKVEAIRLAGL